MHQRLGFYTAAEKRKLSLLKGRLWVHAASVGEVKLVSKIPLFSNRELILTTSTFSGKKLAKKLFPSSAAVIMPLDLIFLWKRFLKITSPGGLVIAETELWPALIFSAPAPRVLFNARMSDDKYRTYIKLGKVMEPLLSRFDALFARDKENLKRFIERGASPEKVKLLGNLKFLQPRPKREYSDPRLHTEGQPVIVAGSTHPGEEEIIIRTVKDLRKEAPSLSLIISPRHIKRASAALKELKKEGCPSRLWSLKKGLIKKGENIVVDTMGDLFKIYSAASAVFVGGSFSRGGGHNVIEPAVWGKAAVIGPSYYNFREEVNYFRRRGGLKVAEKEINLYNILIDWIRDEEKRIEDGKRNFRAYQRKRLETGRSVKELEYFLNKNCEIKSAT